MSEGWGIKKKQKKTSKVQKQRQSWERLVQTCAHARTSTVFLGPRHAHKDLFKTGMNTRCHLRGSGVCLLLPVLPLRLREGEKKELLRNSRGYDLSVLVRSGEVRFGRQEAFLWPCPYLKAQHTPHNVWQKSESEVATLKRGSLDWK